MRGKAGLLSSAGSSFRRAMSLHFTTEYLKTSWDAGCVRAGALRDHQGIIEEWDGEAGEGAGTDPAQAPGRYGRY